MHLTIQNQKEQKEMVVSVLFVLLFLLVISVRGLGGDDVGVAVQDDAEPAAPKLVPIQEDDLATLKRLFEKWGGHVPTGLETGGLDSILCPKVKGLFGNWKSHTIIWCNSKGRVARLSVVNQKLSGPLFPEELTQLPFLYHLEIVGNGPALAGPLPPSIGAMPELARLVISANAGLSGTIPKEFSNLSKLTQASIAENPLLHGELPELPKTLYIAEFFGCSFTGPVPDQWGLLPNLQTLSVFNNQLSGPLPTGLVNLQTLKTCLLKKRSTVEKNEFCCPLPPLPDVCLTKVKTYQFDCTACGGSETGTAEDQKTEL